jgi:hypothetical protein
MFMRLDDSDPVDAHGRDAGFATGHTLVHVESAGNGVNAMSFDHTGGGGDVEVMLKILDGHPAPADGWPL